MPPPNAPETLILPLGRPASPVLVGQLPEGGWDVGGCDVGGWVVRVGDGPPVGGPGPAASLPVTSSKEADANTVCSPIRPVAARLLDPEPTAAPSTVPLMVLPETVMPRVYHVPLLTVRPRLPSTVTEPPFTTC